MKKDNSKDKVEKYKGKEPQKDDKSKELEIILDRLKAEKKVLEKLLLELERKNKY